METVLTLNIDIFWKNIYFESEIHDNMQ